METVKYKFGETPREVIGETPFTDGLRRREWIADRIDGLTSGQLDQFESATDGFVVMALNYNNLLTVLDTLAFTANHGGTYEQHLRAPAYDLRIEILAALGIDES